MRRRRAGPARRSGCRSPRWCWRCSGWRSPPTRRTRTTATRPCSAARPRAAARSTARRSSPARSRWSSTSSRSPCSAWRSTCSRCVIFTPWAWRFRGGAIRLGSRTLRITSRGVDTVRLGSVIVGMGFVMYLIYAEFQIGDDLRVLHRRPHRHVPAVLHHRCSAPPSGDSASGVTPPPAPDRPLGIPAFPRSAAVPAGRSATVARNVATSSITLCSCSPARPGRGRFPR